MREKKVICNKDEINEIFFDIYVSFMRDFFAAARAHRLDRSLSCLRRFPSRDSHWELSDQINIESSVCFGKSLIYEPFKSESLYER